MSFSCNSSIVEDCNVYQDFKTGQNNSVINGEDVNETENTLTCVANNHKLSNDGDKLNHNYTGDMEISSSYNGSIIVEDCIVYQDFKSGRNISVRNEEDINDNTIIKNNSNISLKLKCGSDTAHQFKSNNPDEICITINDGANEIDDQLTVCLNRTLLDENGYTEMLLSTSD